MFPTTLLIIFPHKNHLPMKFGIWLTPSNTLNSAGFNITNPSSHAIAPLPLRGLHRNAVPARNRPPRPTGLWLSNPDHHGNWSLLTIP